MGSARAAERSQAGGPQGWQKAGLGHCHLIAYGEWVAQGKDLG